MQNNPLDRLITLTTDFGLKDPWAGIVKGVILSINPRARVVDITHSISARSIIEGAFVLERTIGWFPDDTVHLAVVDPGVGGARAPVLIDTGRFILVGPDNGLFAPVLEKYGASRVIRLSREEYFLKPVSATFHARDIFAPVAAHLTLGVPVASFGEPLDGPPSTLPVPRPVVSGSVITGEVVFVDNFGNLITNISSGSIEAIKSGAGGGPSIIEVEIKGVTTRGIFGTYSSIDSGDSGDFGDSGDSGDSGGSGASGGGGSEPGAIVGSSGFLEIACFMASASKELGAGVGEAVVAKVVKR